VAQARRWSTVAASAVPKVAAADQGAGMTHRRTVRARGPADLLALVPGLIGFHPEESVVLLTVGAARNGFHARVDLPTDPVELEELAAYLTEVAARNGVRRLALVMYSQDAGTARALTQEVAGRMDAEGVAVVCAVRADGQHWWAIDPERDPDHGGGPGTPYDVSAHPLMAQAVVEGAVVLRSRKELAETLVGTDPEETAAIAVLADETSARMRAAAQAPLGPAAARQHLVLEGRWVRHRVRRFLDDGLRLDPADLARLAVLIVSVEVRDVAWAEMTHGNASRHVDLWRDAVRRVPSDLRAAPAALLAFSAWLSGNGALAWCAVDRCQEADPGYGLAGLIADALAGAIPPSAWRPLPRDALSLFAG